MLLLDLTLPSPAENVALDEALLNAAEGGEIAGSVLRLWEPSGHFVVLGRSSRVAEEVNVSECQARGIPIVRRASGGAAIVAGPGCLMYAVVLPYAGREHLRELDALHRHVLGQVQAALTPLAAGIEHVGTCDLAIRGRKFSGNSVRCKRDHFLYHGTVLHDFDLTLLTSVLRQPPRQPGYRAGRGHDAFVQNLPVAADSLRESLATRFQTDTPLSNWPREQTERLVQERYALERWNFER